MALHLSAPASAALERHAEREYPCECCGLLLGHVDAAGLRVAVEAVALRNANTASPRTRFEFDPREHLAAQREARARSLDVIGFYHSHPDHPAEPSATDLALAAWPGYSYVIVSVAAGHAADVRAYELADDRSRFLPEGIIKE